MKVGDFVRRVTAPSGYVPDPITPGPIVPKGWVADAWQAPDLGCGYFLRAWNDETGQIATIQSEASYEEAADRLRLKIKSGGDWLITIISNN